LFLQQHPKCFAAGIAAHAADFGAVFDQDKNRRCSPEVDMRQVRRFWTCDINAPQGGNPADGGAVVSCAYIGIPFMAPMAVFLFDHDEFCGVATARLIVSSDDKRQDENSNRVFHGVKSASCDQLHLGA